LSRREENRFLRGGNVGRFMPSRPPKIMSNSRVLNRRTLLGRMMIYHFFHLSGKLGRGARDCAIVLMIPFSDASRFARNGGELRADVISMKVSVIVCRIFAKAELK
jgi:hypothetical protein